MAIETPSKYTFDIGGNRSFPVPATIKGSNYCKIAIDDVEVIDTTLYDIINNSIVFKDSPNGDVLEVYVVQSEEAIDDLGSVSGIEKVVDNINYITTLAQGIDQILEIGSIDFNLLGDISVDSIKLLGGTEDQGLLSWNSDEETLDLIQNGVTLQLGQEVQWHCRNTSGSTIPNGTVVMATGTIGASGRITIAPYTYATPIKYIIGITTEDIINDDDGKVTCLGKVRGVDTSSYSEGDILYVGDNGALTNIEPLGTTPNNAIAQVINVHSTNGTIAVRFNSIDENKYYEKDEVYNKTEIDISLNNLDSERVTISGNETISGIKTFSSSPIVPTPTLGTHAATKDYVDAPTTIEVLSGTVLNYVDSSTYGVYSTGYYKGLSVVVPLGGTYKVSFTLDATDGTPYGRIYVNNVAVGTERVYEGTYTENITVSKGDEISVYGKLSGTYKDHRWLVSDLKLYANTANDFVKTR